MEPSIQQLSSYFASQSQPREEVDSAVQMDLATTAMQGVLHASLQQACCPQPPNNEYQSLPLPGDGSGSLPFPQPPRPGEQQLDHSDRIGSNSNMQNFGCSMASTGSASIPRLGTDPSAILSNAELQNCNAATGKQAGPALDAVVGSNAADASPPQPLQPPQQRQHLRTTSSQDRSRARSNVPLSSPQKSRHRGVQWERGCGKWRARIHTDKTRHIGYFDDEDAAAQAWDLAALKHFGPAWKSKLNFPELSWRRFQEESASAAAMLGAGDLVGNPSSEVNAELGCEGVALGPTSPGQKGHQPVAAADVRKLYRGVYPEGEKFRAVLQRRRSQIALGVYDTAEEAARAYDLETLRVNGSGAITNFPLSYYATELEQWQEVYNMAITSHLSGHDSGTTAPSVPPSLSMPFSSMMRPPSPATALPSFAGGAHVKDEGIFGSGEIPAVTSGAEVRSSIGSPAHSPFQKRKAEIEVPLTGRPPSHPAPMSSLTFNSEGRATLGNFIADTVGVVPVGNRWKASLTIDLGTFASEQEAARAYDRASLLLDGLTAELRCSLPEAMAQASAVCTASQHGGGQDEPRVVKGVLHRGGAFLALLDVGGSLYQLGPFPTMIEAAKAHDRYSLLLHGPLTPTNFPPWTYLAPEGEVQSLAQAVLTVKRAQQGSAQQGTAVDRGGAFSMAGGERGMNPMYPQDPQQGRQLEGGAEDASPWVDDPFQTVSNGLLPGGSPHTMAFQVPRQQAVDGMTDQLQACLFSIKSEALQQHLKQSEQLRLTTYQTPTHCSLPPQLPLQSPQLQQEHLPMLGWQSSGKSEMGCLSLNTDWLSLMGAASLEASSSLEGPNAGVDWITGGDKEVLFDVPLFQY